MHVQYLVLIVTVGQKNNHLGSLIIDPISMKCPLSMWWLSWPHIFAFMCF